MQKAQTKYILFVSTTIILTFFLLFISAEILLRVYSKLSPAFFAPTDKSYNQFRPKPNSWVNGFKVNSKGFQEEEFIIPKKADTYRILAIGDSFTLGVVPYRTNFISLLKENLKEKNKSIEILNLGISATTVRDYLSLFVDEGLELNPDLILVNIFIGNDIHDSVAKKESSLYTLRLFQYLRAIYLYNENETNWTKRIGADTNAYAYDENIKTMSDNVYYKLQKDLFIVYFDHKHALGILKHNYTSMFRDLQTLNEICKSKNIKLLVTLLPAEVQVDKDLQKVLENEFIKELPKSGEFKSIEAFTKTINYSLPNKLVKEELNKLKVKHLDMLEHFQEKSKSTRLYKPNDSHWNIAGNELAANLLYDFLLSENQLLNKTK